MKLNGSGSTFVQPLMSKWAEEYHKAKHGQVNYEAIGSSDGVQRLASGLFDLDFACTDAPLTKEQVDKFDKGEVLYIPLVLVPSCRLTTCPASRSR